MTDKPPQIGKISAEFFRSVIFPNLGADSQKVLVGPRHGVDVGIVEIAEGTVMALTADPIFVVPEYGWERAAWFAVHILASDAATSGLPLAFAAFDLNLPVSITDPELKLLWTSLSNECKALGISVVTGHTARYEGCNYPMVGGAMVGAVGASAKYVTPAMAEVEDQVILTKGTGIEATALLGVTFPELLQEAVGEATARQAAALFSQMTVVQDCRTAAAIGVRNRGVTAMHDATECGVYGALVELATASEVGLRIDREAIPVPESVSRVCGHFGMNPYHAISEGSLVVTCKPYRAQALLAALGGVSIQAAIIGEVTAKERGMVLVEGGAERELRHPGVDPFWAVFGELLAHHRKQ
ncbi:MAG: AIR synthase family protein [Acidobacteria bacterium]|nr:AIR synthase family protein [Acidobacteriota bacterium]MCI0568406.1 AIR synthase family protein [Acidobacteriota bacterium]